MAGVEVTVLWDLLDLNPFAVQLRYDILDDEPLEQSTALEQVRSLLEQVEGILSRSS